MILRILAMPLWLMSRDIACIVEELRILNLKRSSRRGWLAWIQEQQSSERCIGACNILMLVGSGREALQVRAFGKETVQHSSTRGGPVLMAGIPHSTPLYGPPVIHSYPFAPTSHYKKG